MAEQATNPTRESGPRTDWDIGKAMNGLFAGAEPDEQELDADADPDEGKEAADEDEEIEASGDEDADLDEAESTSADSFALPLKVGGKDVVIESKEEAIKYAQMGMHYTQEMQKLRNEQAQFASEREQLSGSVRQQVEQYQAALKSIHETYGFVLGKEAPDWSSAEMQKLKAEKPTEYLQIREQWDQLGAIRSELSRIEQDKQKESEKQWAQWVAKEQAALAEKRPEWASDATRRQQDFTLIRDYATQQGITEQEIGSLYDHRFWMILHDAARYRQAEATGKKKVAATSSKTVEPGSGKNVNQGNRQFRAERDRLKQSGDVRAAGNIFQEIMTRKK